VAGPCEHINDRFDSIKVGLADPLLASQEGLCSMEPVTTFSARGPDNKEY
jgi:hypothetical protein